MRLTDFWERMRDVFGPHADSLVELHVFSELGGRTPQQALEGRPSAPEGVWRVVCEAMEVPAARPLVVRCPTVSAQECALLTPFVQRRVGARVEQVFG